MSTSELYLNDDEIAEFIRETQIEPQFFCGVEGREYGICPFITFYVYHQDEDYLPVAAKMIQIYDTLKGFIDFPFQMEYKSATQTWFKSGDSRLPTDLYEEARKRHNEGRPFWLQATDMESPAASALWAVQALVSQVSGMEYSTLKITFHHSWYMKNQAQWHGFVANCLRLLEPEQCYSGFEIGTTASGIGGAYESDVMERICADYFYGLDVDHPGKMGYQYHRDKDGWVNASDFSAGLRTPTWCFLLSPIWLNKLGMDEAGVRQALNDPQIKITALPRSDGGVNLWIQLGELSLYPVEEGVPPLLMLANQLIRPIRCNELELTTLDPWDDDPNPRFDYMSGQRWMRRFDDDSDWPDSDRRKAAKAAPAAPDKRLRGLPGETVPESGLWWTPALSGEAGRRPFNKGEQFPQTQHTEYGAVIWYLDAQQ
jgi:hypothetical protein